MIFSTASARASRFHSRFTRLAGRSSRTRAWQQTQRRSYASGSDHSTHQASSDLPWAIGAAAITVPSVYYLVQPQINKKPKHGGHGHEEHGDHDEHDEKAEEEEEENSSSEEQASSEENSDDQGGEEKSGEKAEDGQENPDLEAPQQGEKEVVKSDKSESDTEQQDTPETSDDEQSKDIAHEKEGGANVEGVQFKGSTSGRTKEGEQGDTRKHIPDAKGFSKKRIESHYGKTQGEAQSEEQYPDNKDLAAASKPAGGMDTQSGKQEGLSNTDTKHSTDITNNPEKSTKGEGTPETSKSKGTVDPKRPQV